jgi:hypothetical protein
MLAHSTYQRPHSCLHASADTRTSAIVAVNPQMGRGGGMPPGMDMSALAGMAGMAGLGGPDGEGDDDGEGQRAEVWTPVPLQHLRHIAGQPCLSLPPAPAPFGLGAQSYSCIVLGRLPICTSASRVGSGLKQCLVGMPHRHDAGCCILLTPSPLSWLLLQMCPTWWTTLRRWPSKQQQVTEEAVQGRVPAGSSNTAAPLATKQGGCESMRQRCCARCSCSCSCMALCSEARFPWVRTAPQQLLLAAGIAGGTCSCPCQPLCILQQHRRCLLSQGSLSATSLLSVASMSVNGSLHMLQWRDLRERGTGLVPVVCLRTSCLVAMNACQAQPRQANSCSGSRAALGQSRTRSAQHLLTV